MEKLRPRIRQENEEYETFEYLGSAGHVRIRYPKRDAKAIKFLKGIVSRFLDYRAKRAKENDRDEKQKAS